MNCQIIGFDCPVEDLCSHCKGTGEEQPPEMCSHCDRCFDEEIGWSTGIESGTASQERARKEHTSDRPD